MTKRMLIDATHAEETRVVVLDGNRLEDFDVETSTKRQLKGNIYLAKVVRVEPSLQAAFVEYGGNRHGFLAFSEIHPDYYQIPVADRQRLIDMEAEEARREEEEADRELEGSPEPWSAPAPSAEAAPMETADESGATAAMVLEAAAEPESRETVTAVPEPAWAETGDESGATAETLQGGGQETAAEMAPSSDTGDTTAQPGESVGGQIEAAPKPAEPDAAETAPPAPASAAEPAAPHATAPEDESDPASRRAQPLIIESDTLSGSFETEADDDVHGPDSQPVIVDVAADTEHEQYFSPDHDLIPESPPPETIGGEPENGEEQRERRMPPRFMRNYKIQEVIRRRQILLVQVVKEERGTKGAALTTYLSLAGRFCVLMPNSPRGGGISRKITSATDRRRLKEIIHELDMPKGMGLIVRTAGANRPKPEIKRDCEYLLRLWDDIREHTLKSVAPALIYEEASLIKRAIRDVYSRDIDEIQVDGEEGWKAAHEFMRMLMPTHAKKVQLWREPSQPLFARYQVEAQLDAMLQPTVQLRSGGYLVINQAEALVAIDVNSGRATRERNVEEMALRTNLEAADEVARQLRLRDLAGLIVIDFIDMESKKHNAMVERRIKEALKNDRARIQVGHISHFGLLEMSRQRLRPSLAETSFILCPHCGGTGHVRSTESAAIHVLRGIEEEGGKRRSAEIVVHVATPTALYILNHKRDRLREIELRYAMRVTVLGDDTQMASQYRIDRVRPQVAREESPAAITPDAAPPAVAAQQPESEEAEDARFDDEAELEEADEADTEAADDRGREAAEGSAERADQADRRRRRRRRRRGGRREDSAPQAAEPPLITDQPEAEAVPTAELPRTEPENAGLEQDLAAETHIEGVPEHLEPAGDDESRRRRGRRGGRRRRREGGDAEGSPVAAPGAEQPDLPPVYLGPTPANPFGGQAFDIFDVLEQAEATAAVRREPPEPIVRSSAPVEPAMTPMPEAAASASARPVMPEEAEAAAAEIVNTAAPEPPAAERIEAPGEEPASLHAAATAVVPETEAASPEEANPDVANDVAPEPAIRPIIIGRDDEQAAEKKRGWWRR